MPHVKITHASHRHHEGTEGQGTHAGEDAIEGGTKEAEEKEGNIAPLTSVQHHRSQRERKEIYGCMEEWKRRGGKESKPELESLYSLNVSTATCHLCTHLSSLCSRKEVLEGKEGDID